MPYEIIQRAASLAPIIALLKKKNVSVLHTKKLEKILKKYQSLPKFNALLSPLQHSLEEILLIWKKFHYIEKKESELNAYRIIMDEKTVNKILTDLNKNEEVLEALNSLTNLYMDENKNFLDIFPKEKQEKKETITNAKDFFLAFGTKLSQNGIYMISEPVFENAFGFSWENEDSFFNMLEKTFHREFSEKKQINPNFPGKQLTLLFYELLKEEFFVRNNVPERIFSCRITPESIQFLNHLTEEDKTALEALINCYLGRDLKPSR